MAVDFNSLANTHIRALTPYPPGKSADALQQELGTRSSIMLACNENPLGPSPTALLAAQSTLANCHLYPDGHYTKLKLALSHLHAVQADQLTIGNGSENILELIVRAYLNQTSSALVSEYAFLTIPILIKASGAKLVTVAAKDFGHDIPGIIKAIDKTTRVIFLVNPNNPTGTYFNTHEFETLLNAVPRDVLIVVDEAYIQYITQPDYPDTLSYLNSQPNLIITRTFSKAYGLAALRLGYAISSPDIADMLNRARLPYHVSTIAVAAGCAALSDQDHLEKTYQLNQRGLQQLSHGLRQRQIPYLPSIANFISIEVGNGSFMYEKLLSEGIIVRPLDAYGLPNYIRVSIGTEAEIDQFLTALDRLCKDSS
jgi:histidinol-phosphate aminotransferase